MTPFAEYLKKIEGNLRAGNATEHTHRPALQALVESFGPGITATNEPKRETCGAPDYIVTKGIIPLGYIETKIVGEPLDVVAESEQLKRYYSLGNLILTDYLEFRWYVGDKLRLKARLATVDLTGKLRTDSQYEEDVRQLIGAFLVAEEHFISKPKELVDRMARLARIIRPYVGDTLADEDESGALRQLMEGFRRVLLHDLTDEQFADMYTQTLCYGLFSARYSHDPKNGRFTRRDASYDIPKTNPFLRDLFAHFNSPDLEDKPYIWAVDDLADLLDRINLKRVLSGFGKSTRKQDPIANFYEPFLAAYDIKMRKGRGVYYTPEPVVSYIVRSVDKILEKDFHLPGGLANKSKVMVTDADGEKRECHEVQILDPATGTGTFLYGVINQVRESFAGKKGMWPGYVRQHLLPRLFAFELLMAPYAVAHMKLGMLLKDTGYDFASDERLNVFLTNALEGAFHSDKLPFWGQRIAEEANAAGIVKRDVPVMVVLGNPPYSATSQTKPGWVDTAIREAYYPRDDIKEANPKLLLDDYVKFLRFAQSRIEHTGYGIVAFITNHGYLDNVTFRGMRRNLAESFDDIYILDLHGNSNKKEQSPDGIPDDNVFDIQQGVAVGIFVKWRQKGTSSARIHHAELWGGRAKKYTALATLDVSSITWEDLSPREPFFLFVPQDTTLSAEYDSGAKLSDALCLHSTGVKTHRDGFVFAFDLTTLQSRIADFRNLATPDEVIAERYGLHDTRDWNLIQRRRQVAADDRWADGLTVSLYRPFDLRAYYHDSRLVELPRQEVMVHMISASPNIGGPIYVTGRRNLAFIASRQVRDHWDVFVTDRIANHKSCSAFDTNYVFPLYLYADKLDKLENFDDAAPTETNTGRKPNLAPEFIAEMETRLRMAFVPDGKGDLEASFGPEDVFHYMYAVFHSPTYRTRYAEFLKMDFPRVPLTSDKTLFRELCALGEELVGLHLMENVGPSLPGYMVQLPTNDPMRDRVDEVRYTEPGQGSASGRVWINKSQYFEGVPMEVWAFHVGGYQVCKRWLNDRKSRTLSYDDLEHYRRIVAALGETIRIMKEIDEVIPSWPVV